MERICDKWNLRRDIQFQTRVKGAEWQAEEGKWKVVVEKSGEEREEYADILTNATGFLRSDLRTSQRPELTVIVDGDGPISPASMTSKATKYTLHLGITTMITHVSGLGSLVTVRQAYRYYHRWSNWMAPK